MSVQAYDRFARRYNQAHNRWLRYGGGVAQAAIEGALATCVRPELRVLDAGCGTGSMARYMLENLCADIRLTLIDPCAAMLAQATNFRARRFLCGIENAPFEDECFDLVLCCWALEASADPARSIRKLTRLLAPGGTLLLVFCAEKPCRGFISWIMKWRIRLSGAGRFLQPHWVRQQLQQNAQVQIREVRSQGPAAAFIVSKPRKSCSTAWGT